MRTLLAIIIFFLIVLGLAGYYLSHRTIPINTGLSAPTPIATANITGPGVYRLEHDINSGWYINTTLYTPLYAGNVNIIANNANAVSVTEPFVYSKTRYALVKYNACIAGAVQAGPYIILPSLNPIAPADNCQTAQYSGPSQAAITSDDANIETTITSDYIRIEANVPSNTYAYEEITLGTFTSNSIILLFNVTPISSAVGLDLYVNPNTKLTINANGQYNYVALNYKKGTTSYNTKVPYNGELYLLALIYDPETGSYSIYYNGHYINDMDGNGAPGSVKLATRNLLTSSSSSAIFYVMGVIGIDDVDLARNLSAGVIIDSDGAYPVEQSYNGEDTTVLVSPGHYIEAGTDTGEDVLKLSSGTYTVTVYPKDVVFDIPGYHTITTNNSIIEAKKPWNTTYTRVKNATLTIYANNTVKPQAQYIVGRDWLEVVVEYNNVPVKNAYVYVYSKYNELVGSNTTGVDGIAYVPNAPDEGYVKIYGYTDSILLEGYIEYTTSTDNTDNAPPRTPSTMPPAEIGPAQLAADNHAFRVVALVVLTVIIVAVVAVVVTG